MMLSCVLKHWQRNNNTENSKKFREKNVAIEQFPDVHLLFFREILTKFTETEARWT